MSRYIFSPEFHRNLWINFSPFRLAAAPLLTGLGALAAMNMDKNGFHGLMMSSLMAYWLVVIIWGSYAASASLQDEARNNTWDFQRISSITPCQYAFGKFFGATSYIWYFGFALWGIFTVAWFLDAQSLDVSSFTGKKSAYSGLSQETPSTVHLRIFLQSSLFLLLSGIFAHALAFYESCRKLVGGAEKIRGNARWRTNMSGFLMGVVGGSLIFFALIPFVGGSNSIIEENFRATIENWHGLKIERLTLISGTLLFFTGWLLIGIWRLLKEGLMHKTWGIAWPFFTATAIIYLAGFGADPVLQVRLGFVVAFLLTYISIFSDAANPSKYRRLAVAITNRNASRIAENMPLWMTSATLLIVFCILISKQAASDSLGFSLAALMFMLRDGFVVHAIFWRNARDRFIVIAYYLLVYLIVPKLHMDIQFKDVEDFVRGISGGNNTSWISASYFPRKYDDWWVSVVPPLLQAILAGFFLKWIVLRK